MIPLAGYTYLAPLGPPGNFGAVFHARNNLSGQDVAIKHIDAPMTPDAKAAWEAEAHAMAACAHENLVAILHAEITPHGPALVMEYLSDGSVAAKFGDDAAPVGAVVDLAIEVCWGLHRLHLEGLTHRDIKPGNLLLEADNVKLGDFGLAGAAGVPADHIYVAHMPPEVQHGQPWTELADIYALAVTAWRLLWGDGMNGRRSPDLHLLIEARKWPDRDSWPIHAHKRLRTALRAGLHPDPGKRPPTAADFRSRLEGAKPVVSWVPVAAGEWHGESRGAQWHVRMRSNRAGHLIETTRDAGHGMRKVGAGCANGLQVTEADSLCREVLESLAAKGQL